MNLLSWISGHFTVRGKALAMYRRALVKIEKNDRAGAIGDYTQVIQHASTPHDIKGMALYNRALAYAAIGDEENAQADLQTALALSGVSAKVRQEVQRRIVRTQHRAGPDDA